jgi:nucleotide-binding universal stress UspA family protein
MSYRTVVVSIESIELPRELSEAIQLVAPNGVLHVLYTANGDRTEAPIEPDHAIEQLRGRMATHRTNASVFLHARRGHRAEEAVRLALESDADLIVMAAYRPKSVKIAAKVVSTAACAVLVVEPNREVAEQDALAPAFPLCPACVKARKHSPEWFCDQHRQSDRLRFEPLDMPSQ